MPKSPKRSTFILIFFAYCVMFALFTAVYDKHSSRVMQRTAEQHSLHLSGHLWDMSQHSAAEYLNLISQAEGYRSVSIYHDDSSLFAEWTNTKEPSPLENFFIAAKLMPVEFFDAVIHYNGKKIGRLHTVWINKNIYIYIYAFVILLLVLIAHVLAWFFYSARSARRQAEVRLEDSRRRLETVVTTAPVIVFSIGSNRIFDVCTGRAIERFGWNQSDIAGHSVQEMESLWPGLQEDYEKAMKGETFTVLRHIGKQSLETRYAPLTNKGLITGVIGVATDVTELEAALDALKERDETMRIEMDLAREIQSWLIPSAMPLLPGFEFGMLFRPSIELSGDVIQVICPPDQHHIMKIIFADISGHGVAAALLSAMFKAIAEDIFRKNIPPAEAMTELNRNLYRQFPECHFASTLYVELNAGNSTMTYVNASQESMFLFRRGRDVQRCCEGGAAPGLLAPEICNPYKETTVRLYSGDTILFFTDGLTEVWNTEHHELGWEKVIAWAKQEIDQSPQILLDRIWNNVLSYSHTDTLGDDVSAIAVRVK